VSVSSPTYSLASLAPWGRRLHLELRWAVADRRPRANQRTVGRFGRPADGRL